MAGKAAFSVDPRLASLLGETYRSTEQALKELIDNAWDADADHVWIRLPEAFTGGTISVRDDGCGMTEIEVRTEYLKIASDRRVRKGERTPLKDRRVKGRKGIGKFAGFIAAEAMALATKRSGACTRLQIVKRHLLDSQGDLESIDLPLESEVCSTDDHGTEIILSNLNQNFSVPMADVLKAMLALEYARQDGFQIFVNDERLVFDDIPGQRFQREADLPLAGRVRLLLTVLDTPATFKQSGIVNRVDGKVVGRPSLLGLEEQDEFPAKLRRRVVGEIEADGLDEAVTADWGGLVENSNVYQEVLEWARAEVSTVLNETFAQDIRLARGRQTQALNRRLAELPEHRRMFANQQIERILKRFYGESEDKIDAIVSVMLDALEQDEYWLVCWHINETRDRDVATFAEALGEFGLVDMAVMARQVIRRLEFLDQLDTLVENSATLEATVHTALASNLWVLGKEYALYSTNQTLRSLARRCGDALVKQSRSQMRPDLLLAQTLDDRYLLIEFKRPSDTVGRAAERQGREYRDDLAPLLGEDIDILVIGGQVDPSMARPNAQTDLRFASYTKLISHARKELAWLQAELTKE